MQNFQVVELHISNKNSFHQLFLKEHSSHITDEMKPAGKTLFIANIPPYISEDNLRLLFGRFGIITCVELKSNQDSTGGFKTGYIAFSERDELLKSLKTNIVQIDKRHLDIGMNKWAKDYNNSICNADKLSKEIDIYMKQYDKTERKKKLAKSNNNDDDGEGWTVVTSTSRKPGLARKANVQLKLRENITEKRKKKEFKNFYTFQIKEGKKKNLTILRKNYEEAKKKVALMKSSRKFKPY